MNNQNSIAKLIINNELIEEGWQLGDLYRVESVILILEGVGSMDFC